MKQTQDKKPRWCSDKRVRSKPDVIAIRKTCDAAGTGLSHYVLMDKQAKQ